MVEVPVPNLPIQHVGCWIGFEDPIRAPADGIAKFIKLSDALIARLVFNAAPCKKSECRKHGQAEFDMVSGIIISTSKIKPDVLSVAQRGISPPCNPVVGREPARPLGFIKEERFLQNLAVVE